MGVPCASVLAAAQRVSHWEVIAGAEGQQRPEHLVGSGGKGSTGTGQCLTAFPVATEGAIAAPAVAALLAQALQESRVGVDVHSCLPVPSLPLAVTTRTVTTTVTTPATATTPLLRLFHEAAVCVFAVHQVMQRVGGLADGVSE